jgi:hypothetical protein
MKISNIDIIGLGILLGSCTPKHSSEHFSVRIVATPSLARHIAADVIQENQIHEGVYWKVYNVKGDEYAAIYIPNGQPESYDDDVLIIHPGGKYSDYQYMDIGVLGGISYVVSIPLETTVPYQELPSEFRRALSLDYLESLLDLNAAVLQTKDIKALEKFIPP